METPLNSDVHQTSDEWFAYPCPLKFARFPFKDKSENTFI